MCSGGSQSNAASASAPYMMQAYNIGQQSQLDNLQERGMPEYSYISAMDVQDDLERQSKYSKLKNERYEKENDPQMYSMRQAIKEGINKRLTDPDALVKRELMRSGLIDSVATGNTNMGDGTMGNAITRSIYGKGYLDYNRQALADANEYATANPSQKVTLDASDLATLNIGQTQAQTNLRNLYKQALLTAGQTATANNASYAQNLMNGIISESGQNALNKNAANNAMTQGMFNLASTGMSALSSGLGTAF